MVRVTDKHDNEKDEVDPSKSVHGGVGRSCVWLGAGGRLLLQGSPQNPKHIKEGTEYYNGADDSDDL